MRHNIGTFLKKYMTLPLLGYLLLAGATAYTFGRVEIEARNQAHQVSVKTENRIAAQQKLQHQQLIQGCVRLNVVRVSDNVSHYADYRFALQQYTFSKGSLTTDYIALKKLGISPKVLKTALKHSQESLVTQKSVVRAKAWVPLTDCTAAVARRGIYYRTPGSISFTKKLPPKSALSITNAERLDPVGSVN